MKELKTFVLLIVYMGCIIFADAQNLNNPNKTGPLGTQVNTISGNLFIPRTDFMIPARGSDIEASFYYNSYNFDRKSGFGNGWSFIYGIKYETDTSGNKILNWGDGREDEYKLVNGTYSSPIGFYSNLSQYQANKFLLTELNGDKYYFDDPVTRKITKMEDRNGNAINFLYTDSLLTSLQHTSGLNLSFTYNSNGNLIRITDDIMAPTRNWNYLYDQSGNLLEVTDPLGSKQKYTYLVNGPMKTLTDKNLNKVDIIYFSNYSTREIIGCNKRLSFSYDTSGRASIVTEHLTGAENQITKYLYTKVESLSWVTSIQGNCCGYNLSFEYDLQGNKIKQVDANGNEYRFTYDQFGKMLTSKDPLGYIKKFTYTNDFHQPETFTDPKGNVYSMNYDVTGNVIQFIQPGGLTTGMVYASNGDLIQFTDPKGNVITIAYDVYGNPISISKPLGQTEQIQFNARGQLLSTTDAKGFVSTSQYDILDRVISVKDPANHLINMTYDAMGNMLTYKNENGQQYLFSFDASNRMVSMTDPKGYKYYVTYDEMDNVTSKKDALGNQTRYFYDKLNRITKVTDAVGNNIQYEYDANGNKIRAISALGQTYTNTFDKNNRIIVVKDESGVIASFEYDGNGNNIKRTNAVGGITTLEFDALNRLVSVRDPLNNIASATYDNNGNMLSIKDMENAIKSFSYDALNRKISMTNKNNNTVIFTYDLNDNVSSVRDEKNNTTLYEYDNLNRKIKTILPDNKYTEPIYDNFGNITSLKLTDGSNINYVYDSLNKLVSKTIPGVGLYNYSYDPIRRLTSAVNTEGIVSLGYDQTGRIITESFNSKTVRYTYDAGAGKVTVMYPDSSIITKKYNKRGFLESIKKDSTNVVNYEYTPSYMLKKIQYNNAVSTNYQYDFANRLTNITTGNGVIQNLSFNYNRQMMKTQIQKNNTVDSTQTFTYDNDERLTQYTKGPLAAPLENFSYQYDAVGNRLSLLQNGVNTNYVSNNLNQLVSATTGPNTISYTYDNRGNLTFDGTFYKTYDAENRIIKDSSSPTNKVIYRYDAFGRRIQKKLNNTGFNYVYSAAMPIQIREFLTDSVISSTIFSDFNRPVVISNNSNSFFYHQNEIGSIDALTAANGQLTEKYRYTPYGGQEIYSGTGIHLPNSLAGNNRGFTGKEYDNETQNVHFIYREYSPSTGTFNQRDPLGYTDAMGLYQYTKNDPVNKTDALGLLTEVGEKVISEISNTAQNSSYVYEQYLQSIQRKNAEGLLSAIENLSEVKHRVIRGGKGVRKSIETYLKSKKNFYRNAYVKNAKMITKMGSFGNSLTTIDVFWKLYLISDYESECPDSDEAMLEQAILWKDAAVGSMGFYGPGGLINLADWGVEKVFGTSVTTGITKSTFYTNEFLNDNLTFDNPWGTKTNLNPLLGWNLIGKGLGALSVPVEGAINSAYDTSLPYMINNVGPKF